MLQQSYSVVWNGKDPLLPPREQRINPLWASMPSFDLDDGESIPLKPVPRKYTWSGRYRKDTVIGEAPQDGAKGADNGE